MELPFHQSGRISTKGLVVILLFIVLAASTLFLFQNRGSRDPQATAPATEAAANFMDAAAEQDGATSYSFFSDSMKERISQGAWQSQLDYLFANPDNAPEYVSAEILNDGQDGEPESQQLRYAIILTIAGQEGREVPYTMNLMMVKNGDSWKVNSMDIQKQ